MKKRVIIFLAVIATIGATIVINGCAASEKLTSKTGAELWSQNCLRCHNAPDPADYSDPQWEAIG
ncbi:MAG TPA: cytochrome c, partial [Bacteroidia bacterium]|nr:cytochrome c [Bacteroidia bacterium]